MTDQDRPPQLDQDQRAAVDHDGPVLVLGGPGTGKSTVLAERFLRLSAEHGAVHRVLLLLDRRGQAAALRDELPWRLPQRVLVEVPVHTWHAFALHLVSRYYRACGFAKPPALLSPAEQWGYVRELLDEENPAVWGAYGPSLPTTAFADEVAAFCLLAGHRMTTREDLEELAATTATGAVARFALKYRTALRASSRIDAPGALGEAARLLTAEPEIAEAVRRRFPVTLVDDAHDLTAAHWAVLGHLSIERLACCGDPGVTSAPGTTDAGWLEAARALAPGADTIELRVAHRFGPQVGEVATRLAADRGARPEVASSGPPGRAEVRAYSTFSGEVEATAREARRAHVVDGVSYEQIAIVCAHPSASSGPLRQALDALRVPYRVASSGRALADEPAVRWVFDLVRASLSDDCPDEVVCGVLASPLIGLEAHEVRDLRRQAFKSRKPLREVIEGSDSCAAFAALSAEARRVAASPADEALGAIIEASPWVAELEHGSRPAAEEHHRALVSLTRSVGRFVERRPDGTLLQYVETIGRASVAGQPPATARHGVTITTMAGVAGDEWQNVIVFGMTDGPLTAAASRRGIFDPWATTDHTERALEQEAADRRAFRVAVTRARASLMVTTSPGPTGRAVPSRLLEQAFGTIPEPNGTVGGPALTLLEATGRLRKTLAGDDPVEAAAATAALALVDGVRPQEWWWRRDWTPGTRPLAPDGVLTTSYSRIGTYENCPLQYVLQSVLGLDPQTTYQMKFGSLVHKVIELTESGTITDWEAALRTYRGGFDPGDYPNLVFARTYYRSGVQMLKRWWRLERGKGHTVKVEFSFNDLDVDGHTIRGRIDRVARVGNGLTLVDYKTSRTMLGREDAQQSLQLAIYYLAARNDDELAAHGEPQSMQLVYLAYEDADPPQVARRVQRPRDADETLDRLKVFLGAAAAERFVPSPEADCRWCKMRPLCPRWPEGRETGP